MNTKTFNQGVLLIEPVHTVNEDNVSGEGEGYVECAKKKVILLTGSNAIFSLCPGIAFPAVIIGTHLYSYDHDVSYDIEITIIDNDPKKPHRTRMDRIESCFLTPVYSDPY